MQKIFLSILVILIYTNSFAQDGGCSTVTPPNLPTVANHAISEKTISFYFHIVRDDFGNGGHTNQQIDQQINLLFSDLASWSIIGVEVGRDIIKSSYYLDYNSYKFNSLINANPHNNAIDVYFTGGTWGSMAADIPSTSCVITFNGIGNRLISHEVGHCLGLLHTHEFHQTCEDITGHPPECLICGDQICDTPPDPGLQRTFYDPITNPNGNVNIECNYIGDEYAPDTRNIMSYTPYPCAEWFTSGQAERMHWYLDSYQLLIDTYYYISAPENLTWMSQNNNPLLQWSTVPNANLLQYKIYRNFNGCGINCGAYTLLGTVPASQTSYLDQEVIIGGKFSNSEVYYYVTAITTQNNESVNSNRITIPTNMVQKVIMDNQLRNKFENTLNIYPNPINPTSNDLHPKK